MTRLLTIPTTEPFFFQGNKTACLLIHGFTGTPKEMRWMGEFLNEKGFTCMGIRLAGHATQLEDMMRTHWQDWLASVEDGLNLLSASYDRIILIGLSMGGALSLLSTARYAKDFKIAATIAMAAPYDLPKDWRLSILNPVSAVLPRVSKGGDSDWFDDSVDDIHQSYEYYPSRGILELRELLRNLRNEIHHITTPVCLMQSRDDTTIPANSMALFYEQIASKSKQMTWINNSGHVITEDHQKQFVYQAAYDFIHQTT